MKLLNRITIIGLVAILFLGMATNPGPFREFEIALLKVGDSFPDFKLEGRLTAAETDYLGLADSNRFVIGDIQAEIIIIEFFNKYCAHCQQFAPILNELYYEIEQNPNLKAKVKLLGVGMGNNSKQIQIYQAEQHIPFPLIPDSEFKIHDALGRPKAPFTVIFKKTENGKGIVSATYLGMAVSKDQLVQAITELLQPAVFVLADSTAENTATRTKTQTANFTEEDFLTKVKDYLQANDFYILALEPVSIDKRRIYKVHLKSKNVTTTIFIEEIFRNTVCDVCHDTHFWYGFDIEGTLRYFVPLYLPKSYNKEWDQNDVEKFRRRLTGQSILNTFEFNPETDAVTTATITSSLIFDTMNKSKQLYSRFIEEGIIKK